MSSPSSTLDAPPPGSDRSRPWYASPTGLLKAAGIGLVLSSFGIWGYAYSGRADRPTPDLLADQTFPAAAEEICAAAVADTSAMPQAPDARDNGERAEQVRASTARFEQMIDELAAVVGGTPRDVAIEKAWLDDWRVVVKDRYRYADAVAENPAAPYYMTDTGVNERLDRRVTRLATTNRMPACSYPEDVG
ncbi:MAG: hypothetical protein R2761_11815 [Acidimicrobiales bacterium]